MRAWDVNGKMPDALFVAPLPQHLEYLWSYFRELDRRRGSSGLGPTPLSEEVIHRWETRKRVVLEDWEYRALLAADDAFMEFQAEASAIRSKSQ